MSASNKYLSLHVRASAPLEAPAATCHMDTNNCRCDYANNHELMMGKFSSPGLLLSQECCMRVGTVYVFEKTQWIVNNVHVEETDLGPLCKG